ncbi:MAG: insulinase family protein [Chloroflexota bacterium]|nr:insulinase family protein [Chloroflexota bacterium]
MKLKSALAICCVFLVALAFAACSDDDPPQAEEQSTARLESVAERAQQEAESRATATEEEEPESGQEASVQQQGEAGQEEERTAATAEAETEPEDSEQETSAEAESEAADWDPDELLPFDPDAVRGELSNGLTYFIRQNVEPPARGQLSLVVRAGSILEEEEQRGLAHFVEHMAFNGTARFAKQEIVSYLESLGSSFGPDLNAGTSYDYTVYWLEIPTDDPEILETAFQILSDWAFAISFDPEEVELERGVILEEWRLYQGFDSRFFRNLNPLLFGSSHYADREVIGLVEVIENAPVEQLVAYYERWYRPDLMAVVAVGDFDSGVIEGKIKQHFAPPPEGESTYERAAVAEPTDRPTYDVPDNETPLVDVFTDPEAPGTQSILVRKVAPEIGQDLAGFRRVVAEQLAFMMLNARLFERGQEANAPWLWSGSGRGEFVEPFDILTFAIVTEPDGVESGFQALLEEMQRAGQHGFTDGELEREQTNLLSSAERRYTQRDQVESTQVAERFRQHYRVGAPVPGPEAEWDLYQRVLPLISLDEVDALARSWIQSENTVLLVLGPEEIDPSGGEELAAALQFQLDHAGVMVVDPYADTFDDVPLLAQIPTAGSIVSEASIDSIDAVEWTLSNGVTVIAKQTDFKDDEVRFTSFSPGGHSLVSDEDFVSASYAGEIAAGSGVGPHDLVALDKLLAGKRVSVTAYIDELFEGLRGSASPQDLETLFQLSYLYATEARFDPDFYSTFEAGLRSQAELRPTQPDWVLFDRVNTLLSDSHLRRRPLSVAVVDELSFARAEAVYAERFADISDSTFVFVGAFDWDELRSLAETYLASLPSTGRTEQWRDIGASRPQGVIDEAVRIGIEPRSNTVWVFSGEMDWSRGESLALTAAGEVLQIRLRERVREQLGGTYAIQVGTRATALPDSDFLFFVIFGSDPDRVEELLGEVEGEMDWLRGGGEQEYLDTVKELLRTDREEDLRDNGFWLSRITNTRQRGDSFEAVSEFDVRLEALTLEQVVSAARRYLPMDRFIRVVLYPEAE